MLIRIFIIWTINDDGWYTTEDGTLLLNLSKCGKIWENFENLSMHINFTMFGKIVLDP